MKSIIYLDNNATTMVAPEVVKVMDGFFTKMYANPSSLHFFGQEVAQAVADAREVVAKRINCSAHEIVFTASGSEGDNLCIKGYCEANKDKGKHIITSKIEHPAVLNACKNLEEEGFSVSYLDVDKEGFVNPSDVEKSIREDTILVSIMHANNEIGSIQPIKEISELCKSKHIAFHTDAVQSFLKLPFDVKELGVTMASFSGHKIHAPKGVGFVYIKEGTKIRRQIDGGGQEFKLRAGTENTPYICGLAEAIKRTSDKDITYMKELQKYLLEELQKISGFRLNGPHDLDRRVCNNINVSSSLISGEMLLSELSKLGICVSTGSACSSKSTKASPVLVAINCPVEYLHGNVRISISRYTTRGEIDQLILGIKQILDKRSSFTLKSFK